MPRRYGVEIEHFGLNDNTEYEILNGLGIPMGRNQWQIRHDGSVNGEALELVSPILDNGDRSHDAETRTILKPIREAGGKVDYSCGLHIHQEAVDKSPDDIYRIVNTYVSFQEAIDSILPRARRSGRGANYCHPITDSEVRETKRQANNATSLRVFAENVGYWDRYRVLNVCSLQKYGTLEFRQHSGTLNASKILHWRRLTNAMMNRSDFFTDDVVAEADKSSIESLLNMLQVPQSTKDFYAARKLAINGPTQGDEEDNAQHEETDQDCGCCEEPMGFEHESTGSSCDPDYCRNSCCVDVIRTDDGW